MIVAKFGGTSMADANQIRKVAKITASDEYGIVVVSAPGKRFKDDIKMTDLLYNFAKDKDAYSLIYSRLKEIEDNLGIDNEASEHFLINKDKYFNAKINREDLIASRGEYYSAWIFSKFTNRVFLDTAPLIDIDENGNVISTSYEKISKAIDKSKRYVAPGFFGSDKNGNIKTFSRGGSDITGSIFACAVNASVYENWTDVSGIKAADPRID